MVKYDNMNWMSLLVVAFQFQSLGIVGLTELLMVDDDESIFGAMTSKEAILNGLLKNELSLVHCLHVKLENYLLPLIGWNSHEIWFPNMSFVAWQILGIPKSQIEIEILFNIVGMLTSLWHCKLGVKNLNKLVMIMKNWSTDARVNCL